MRLVELVRGAIEQEVVLARLAAAAGALTVRHLGDDEVGHPLCACGPRLRRPTDVANEVAARATLDVQERVGDDTHPGRHRDVWRPVTVEIGRRAGGEAVGLGQSLRRIGDGLDARSHERHG